MEKHSIVSLIEDKKYEFVGKEGKDFIADFDSEMIRLGYTSNSNIGNGFCWGKYMIIYTKSGLKSQKSYARIYIKENGSTCLRMYFSDVDKHKEALEAAPEFIQKAFTGEFGACNHCHNQKDNGICMHRKSYTIANVAYEKCDGFTFYFANPDTTQIPEYLKLFTVFYPARKHKQ